MEEVVKLLAPLNTTKLEENGEGTDISPWMQAGVPGQFNRQDVTDHMGKWEVFYLNCFGVMEYFITFENAVTRDSLPLCLALLSSLK